MGKIKETWSIVLLKLQILGELITSERTLVWVAAAAILMLAVRAWPEIRARSKGFVWRAAFVGSSDAILHMRFIAALFFAYFFALFVPGQSLSLQSSLAAAFYLTPDSDNLRAGFEATTVDAVAWIAGNILLLCYSWAYFDATFSGQPTSAIAAKYPSRYRFWRTLTAAVLLTAAAYGSLLAPLLSSPLMRESLPAMVLVIAIAAIPLARGAMLPRWWSLGWTLCFYLVLSIAAIGGYEMVANIGVGLAVVRMFVGVLRSKRPYLPTLNGLADVTAGLIVLSVCFELRSALHAAAQPGLTAAVILVSAVWMLPGAFSAVLFKERLIKPQEAGALRNVILGAVTVLFFVHLLINRNGIALLVLPAILCFVMAFRLTAIRLTARFPSVKRLGAFLVIALSIIGGFVIYKLSPDLDLSEELRGPPRLADVPKSQFKSYYDEWQAEHHQTGEVPMVLVAAAGGGIRAGAHVAMTLAASDEATQGWLRNHIFAISGVSGGSLGALAWTAAVDDGLFRATSGATLFSERPWTETMRRYFSEDFLSPSMSQLLLHDFPLAPFLARDGTTRDHALLSAWVTRWKALDTGLPNHSNLTRFETNLNARPAGQYLEPLLMFNSTTAADGKRAVASSLPVDLPGARILSAEEPAINAVLDSARFPIVSAVGTACASTPVVGLRTVSNMNCSHAYSPVQITDGGYADNSGLETISELLVQLESLSKNKLENVYVVYITSDPDENLPFIDGERFNPASMTATLTSPLTLMEEARAGRARDIAATVEHMLPAGHFIRWGLSSRTYYDNLLRGIPTNLPEDERERRMRTMLRLPPLGWTLDPVTAPEISFFSLSDAMIFTGDKCGQETSPAHTLCQVYRSSLHHGGSTVALSATK